MHLPRRARIPAVTALTVAACLLAACEPADSEMTAAADEPTDIAAAPNEQSNSPSAPTVEPHGVNYDKDPCGLIDLAPLNRYGFNVNFTDTSLRPTEEELDGPATVQMVCTNSDWSVTLDAHYKRTPEGAVAAVTESKPAPASYQMSQGTYISPLSDEVGYLWVNQNRGDSQASWATGNYQHVLTIVWDTTNPNLPHTTNKTDLLEMVEQVSSSTEERQREQGW